MIMMEPERGLERSLLLVVLTMRFFHVSTRLLWQALAIVSITFKKMKVKVLLYPLIIRRRRSIN
jgi:hypothetical protein